MLQRAGEVFLGAPRAAVQGEPRGWVVAGGAGRCVRG